MSLFSLLSFPTIYFAPAGKKQSPKKYEASILLLVVLCKEVASRCPNNTWRASLGQRASCNSISYPGNAPGGTLCCMLQAHGRSSACCPSVSCLAPELPLLSKGSPPRSTGTALLSCAFCRVAEK